MPAYSEAAAGLPLQPLPLHESGGGKLVIKNYLSTLRVGGANGPKHIILYDNL
jgi:hypothetical protein